jgi:hypothetical protein
MALLNLNQDEPIHAAEHIEGKLNINHCNVARTVLSGQTLKAGHVVGRVTLGSASSAAKSGGNTGTGTMGTVTLSGSTIKAGVYKLRIIAAATNAGTFELEDPDGLIVGIGTVAVAFSQGGLAFTLADGGTDFVVGDGFDITVAAGSGKVKEYNPANTDGSQYVAGVLWDAVDASAADAPGVVTERGPANIVAANLAWFSGATTNQKNDAIAALAALGIVAL